VTLNRRLTVAAVLLWLAAFPTSGRGQPASGPAPEYAAELIEHARALKLADQRQWIRLGHWRRPPYPTRFVYYKSEADGPAFFLSPAGKESPAAELEATLRHFATSVAEGNEHPICRFPARFAWLDRVLGFDRLRMRVPRCPEFAEFVSSMRPKAVVVVFSSYFMGRAASAFGHTFLRVERAGEPHAIGKRRQLLDTGIDYAATTTTTNPVLYALMGIFGGFRGHFSKMPYYYKVRTYNDFESRDLWEYELALTPAERTLAIAHLWELGGTYFDYFYMTENCSYHILGVVDVVKPELGLVETLRVPVVPADTVKALASVPGLVARVTFRPSLNTQFRARLARLDGAQRDLLAALVTDPEAPFPASMSQLARVEALDAAADLVDLRWPEDVVGDPSSKAARTKLALLRRRAKIPAPSADLVIEPPWHDQPHRAHGSGRLAAGGGWREGPGPFTELAGRINLHDLLDNPSGYPEQSSIEFLPFRVRLYTEAPKLALEQLSLVRITQLSSFSRFNKNVAWSIDVGGARIRDEGCADCFAGHILFGGGLARSFAGSALTLYGLLDAQARWHPDLDGLAGSGFRLAAGPRAGLRLRLRNNLIGLIEGGARWLPVQEPVMEWEGRGGLRWQLTPDFALDVAASSSNQSELDAAASVMHYF
jgi:hypothetical protein